MKLPRIILLLQILTMAVVLAIFIWQMITLPGLRTQLRTGMHTSLNDIAREAGVSLDRHFTRQVLSGGRKVQEVPLAFTESNLAQMQLPFSRIKATEPISNAWLVAFCDSALIDPATYEYVPPGRYRPESDFAGSWRKNTDLCGAIQSNLDSLVKREGGMEAFIGNYRKVNLDRPLAFSYQDELNPTPLIGSPIFHPKTGALQGFVFCLVDDWYLENRLIPDFFNTTFHPVTAKDQGIDEKYLRYGVYGRKGNQLIYNSVAFGRRDFEHVFSLADVGSWLGVMKVGVSFRNSTADEVADSIYDRNFFLIFGLFVALIIFLGVLFWAARRLVRLSHLKTEFVANVSHEIRTPLAGIRLASDTLRLGRARSPEQLQTIVGILSRESERLDFLVRTLLDFSQLESGRKKYKLEVMEVGQWWESIQRLVREKAGGYLNELGQGAAEGRIEVDRLAVEQVVSILIDNAIKYGGETPKVDCRLRRIGEEVVLEVQDYGIGIAKADQKIIFEKFVRIGNADVHNVKGHGIGLSIAKAVMRDLKGSITVESAPGQGSTFRLHFPLMEENS